MSIYTSLFGSTESNLLIQQHVADVKSFEIQTLPCLHISFSNTSSETFTHFLQDLLSQVVVEMKNEFGDLESLRQFQMSYFKTTQLIDEITTYDQRTPEWLQSRLYRITGSVIGKILGNISYTICKGDYHLSESNANHSLSELADKISTISNDDNDVQTTSVSPKQPKKPKQPSIKDFMSSPLPLSPVEVFDAQLEQKNKLKRKRKAARMAYGVRNEDTACAKFTDEMTKHCSHLLYIALRNHESHFYAFGIRFQTTTCFSHVKRNLPLCKVDVPGLKIHPIVQWIGGSVDGVVYLFGQKIGILEIKCPYSKRIYPTIPLSYVDQMQLNCFATGARACFFFVWTPYESRTQIVFRDDYFINNTLLPKSVSFFTKFIIPLQKQQHRTNEIHK